MSVSGGSSAGGFLSSQPFWVARIVPNTMTAIIANASTTSTASVTARLTPRDTFLRLSSCLTPCTAKVSTSIYSTITILTTRSNGEPVVTL